MIEQYTKEARNELQHTIAERREQYEQAMLSRVGFYELKKLRAEISELEKQLQDPENRLKEP